jgi:CBS domain-containing protein
MTDKPVILKQDRTAAEAARMMRDEHVGNVLVTNNGELYGIVTDRDLVVRCIANGENPEDMKLGQLCSKELRTVSPEAELREAIAIMSDSAIRRLPVVDGKKPVGIVTLGDLAVALDRDSVLGEISAAPPNH